MDGNAEGDVIPTGAGPGSLTTAKAMLDEGLEPIVFEARFRAELARLGRDPAAPLPEEVDLLRTLAAAEAPYPAVQGALHTLERD